MSEREPKLPAADEFLAGLNRWVAVESPSDDATAVNRVVDLAEADFRAAGLATERVAGRNKRGDHLLARAPWNDGRPGILLLGHLDTVHPIGSLARNPIRTENGRAYGPGILDMKSGAFLALAAIKALIEAGEAAPLPVSALLVSDEEVGSETSRALIEAEARNSRYALVLEPARAGGEVVTSRKGVARFEIAVTGRPSHSGNAHAKGRSAIRELARQVLALEAMTDYARGITVNVGLIRGGTAENVVPETAWASIDLRVPSPEAGMEMVEKLLALKASGPDLRVEVTGAMNRAPYRKADRPDVAGLFERARMLAAARGLALKDLPDGEGSGGSDGQFCVPYCAVLDGLGLRGLGLHTHDEYIEIDSIAERGLLVLDLLRTLR
jgi:glutamate carboxypeptidase